MTEKSTERSDNDNKNHKQNIPIITFEGYDNQNWEEYYFGELFEIKNGLNKGKEFFGHGTPILNYMDVNQNTFNSEKTIKGTVELTPEEIGRYAVQYNDLFLTRTSETSEEIGLSSCYMGNDKNTVFSGFILRARPQKEDINSLFYSYYLRTPKMRNNIIKYSSITTRALINSNNLSKMKIKKPPIELQNKIAELFYHLDEKISLMEKKYQQYTNYKKYLLKNMFSNIKLQDPSLRFAEFTNELQVIPIKEFLKESKIKVSDDLNKRLSVKLHLKGIFKREIKSIEKEGATIQYLRKKGQFIYGKQNFHNGAFGIIPENLNNYLSSSDIPSFDFVGDINKYWFLYYLSDKDYYVHLENYSNGTGSKRISPETFLNLKIKVPSIEEQNKIVILISNIETKTQCIENEINLYKNFKHYLLNKMFC